MRNKGINQTVKTCKECGEVFGTYNYDCVFTCFKCVLKKEDGVI